MYKVLLVDDERMILDGISQIVDWKSQEVELVGKAMNGIEAMDFIERNPPDIVITDITMPGLDGIGLVSKAKDKYPYIKWIFLSGFSEFEYARQAMRYGVRHYLLKPCNEEQISNALYEIVQEKKQEEEATEYFQSIEEDAHKLLNYEHEDLLNRFLVYKQLPEDMKTQFEVMISENFNNNEVCLSIINLENEADYLYLKQIDEKFKNTHDHLKSINTIVGNSVVIMQEYTQQTENTIKLFHQFLVEWCDRQLTTIISEKLSLKDLLNSKFRLEEAINQSFYSEPGEVITSSDWVTYNSDVNNVLESNLDKIIVVLKQKDLVTANNLLADYCCQLFNHNIHPSKVKIYFVQMYLLILSKYNSDINENRMETINKMDDFSHLKQFQDFFQQLFERLIKSDQHTKRYSKVVKQMMEGIEKEIENPELSLQWLGNNYMYMNSDYLGKIFKKEVGQRFSTYVTNARVNRAVEIIETEEDVKVFELAERMGFGNNPQYFSQLFKRIKGYTPTEIIRSHE